MSITPAHLNFLTFARGYAFAVGSSPLKINASELSILWLLARHRPQGLTLKDIYDGIPEKDTTTLFKAVLRLRADDCLRAEQETYTAEGSATPHKRTRFFLGENAAARIATWADAFSAIVSPNILPQ